jgi:hypothetical protein
MTKTARLFVAFHPVCEGDSLPELRRQADQMTRSVAVLERLEEAGWKIVCTGADHGIVDYAAERAFESPLEAVTAAAAAGAHGHMLEWPGELEYFEVGAISDPRVEVAR